MNQEVLGVNEWSSVKEGVGRTQLLLLNDIGNPYSILVATTLQNYYHNFGTEFFLDDVTDRDALEDSSTLGASNLVLLGGVYVNTLTAYLTRFWEKTLRPGF